MTYVRRSKRPGRATRAQVLKWQVGFCAVAALLVLVMPLAPEPASQSRQLSVETEEDVAADEAWRLLEGDDNGDFPEDMIDNDARKKGGLIVHILVMVYMFAGLAIICDVFFEASLEKICEHLDISEDVAGASFMAAGGSAPELFTSIIGTFVTKSDIGFGTIVGSAVFNVLFVLGVCGLLAGQLLALSWYPLARDSIWYTVTLVVIVLFVGDNRVYWYEAVVMFVLYLIYLYIMKRNEDIKAWCLGHAARYNFAPDKAQDADEVGDDHLHRRESKDNETALQQAAASLTAASETGGTGASISAEEAAEQGAIVVKPQPPKPDDAADKKSDKGDDDDDDDDDDEPYMEWPENDKLGQALYIILWPLKMFMKTTIPDCEEKPHLYLVAFAMSIVHIAIYSYFMVWMADTIGRTLGIPTPVMGVTILAGGTSIPDALSSLAVAKRGFGDMAVSSSIGSNVFDITVGLPVPWMLWCLIASFNDDPTDDFIIIHSETLWLSVTTLLFMLLVTVLSIHFAGWVLSPKLSIVFIVLYFVFVAESLLLEYEVIKV